MEDYHSLSENWLTEGRIDLEYKSYLLMAYLKRVKSKFSNIELYPPLKDLIEHRESLIQLKRGKDELGQSLQKNPLKIDLRKLKIIYDDPMKGEEWMKELQEIIDYSLPLMNKSIDKGKTLYEELERMIQIEPIGIIPIKQTKGFVFFRNVEFSLIDVYWFEAKKMDYQGKIVKGIYTQFLESVKKGFSTLEGIKGMLAKKYREATNPAAFFVRSEVLIPREATLLPIAKRKLLEGISV